MKFIRWFLSLFPGAKPELRSIRYSRTENVAVKFPAGMHWTCPDCEQTIGVAKRDIYYGDAMASSEWDVRAPGFYDFKHCLTSAARVNAAGLTELHTPAGWVG